MSLFEEEFNEIIEKKLKKEQQKKPSKKKTKKKSEEDNLINDLKLATKKGIEEIDVIHNAYKTFLSNIHDLVLFPRIYPLLFEFGNVCDNIEAILEGDPNVEGLIKEEIGDQGLEQLKKFKAELLSDLWNRYYKGGDQEDDVPF